MRLVLFCLLTLSMFAVGAVRNDVVVLEASEGLRYSTQEISREYLMSYLYPYHESSKSDIKAYLKILDENVRKIATNTNDKKTKDLLSYFASKRVQASEILSQKMSMDSVESMVEIGEIFTEGSRSIAKQHIYPLSLDEQMLMNTREMNIQLSIMVKYYILYTLNPKDKKSIDNLDSAISSFENKLKDIKRYNYNIKTTQTRDEMINAWDSMRQYLRDIDKLKVPALLSISSKDIQNLLTTLGIYHSKNQ